ncbi:MAG: HTH domain-containing protein [Bacteroidaceae bacterium]|nr:HTH domain-containing protein [Bacteroidaceae bacterium]
MELSSKLKDAVSYGRGLVSVTTEKAKQNKALKGLTTKSLQAFNAAVNSTSTYFTSLNQEVKASMAEHSRHYDVIKADDFVNEDVIERPESRGSVSSVKPLAARKEMKDVVSSVRQSVIKLSQRQLKIVKLILRQEEKFTVRNDGEYSIANLHNELFVTADSLSKKYKVHARTIQRDLARLQQIGLIEHVGSDKGGYWRTIRTNM